MSKGCGCSWCDTRDYKEFRQNHGGGPEEMPYRKKGKGKKFCKVNKGPHVADRFTEWATYSTYRYRYSVCACGKRMGWGSQSQRLVEYTYIINGEEFKRSHWT